MELSPIAEQCIWSLRATADECAADGNKDRGDLLRACAATLERELKAMDSIRTRVRVPADGTVAGELPGTLKPAELATVPGLHFTCASVEYQRRADKGFELLVWLGSPHASRYLRAGGFWANWTFGSDLYWVRFQHDCSVFNRAGFAAAEVRSALDPAQRPQGVLWLP